jgi:hypothetical protein
MAVTNIDRLEAMLAAVGRRDVEAISAGERQLLSAELQRVYRIVEGERIVDDARKATAPAGVLGRLKRGERSQ